MQRRTRKNERKMDNKWSVKSIIQCKMFIEKIVDGVSRNCNFRVFLFTRPNVSYKTISLSLCVFLLLFFFFSDSFLTTNTQVHK